MSVNMKSYGQLDRFTWVLRPLFLYPSKRHNAKKNYSQRESNSEMDNSKVTKIEERESKCMFC